MKDCIVFHDLYEFYGFDKLVFVGLAMRACLSLWERCPQGGEGPLRQLR